jgi:4-hydroxy-tetrahydrodipicolinate synthase
MGRLVELAVAEVGDRATIVAGTGGNDTRHCLHLTERATEAGADATLNVVGYYNRPNRRGIVAHYRELSQATDKPIVVYNIPSRTTVDVDNELLAELAQLDHVDAVKQANHANLAMIDGLDLYAGNDDMLADAVELGAAGGVCVASHLVGEDMRRMIDEPEHAREIHDRLLDLFASLGVTTNPIPIKAAMRLVGLDCGGLRLPLVEADEAETERVRSALDALGLLSAV